MELKSLVRESYREIKEGNHLEKTLWFLAKLREFSLANTLLLIKQTRGRVRYAQGAGEWSKRFGTSITKTAKPLYIYAPIEKGKDFSVISVFDVSDTEMGGQGPTFRPRHKTTVLVNAFAKKAGISLVVKETQKEPMKFSASENKVSLNCQNQELTFHALKGIALINLERLRKKGKFSSDLPTATAIACAYAFEVRCFLQETEGIAIPDAARKIIFRDVKMVLNESHRMAQRTMNVIEKIQAEHS